MLEFIRARETREAEEQEPLVAPKQSIWDQKEYLEFVKHYSEDETIPLTIKTGKWGIFGKALQYTFLEEGDIPLIDIFNNTLRIDALMAKPAHMITFEEVHTLDQTQLYFWLTAKRAIGTNREKMNERTLQNTQISQAINTQVMNQQRKQGGFFSKLRGIL